MGFFDSNKYDTQELTKINEKKLKQLKKEKEENEKKLKQSKIDTIVSYFFNRNLN